MRIPFPTMLVVSLSAAGLLCAASACKKDESDPDSIPVDTAAAEPEETAEPEATAEPEDTSTAEADAEAPASTAQPTTRKGSSIDGCCLALRGVAAGSKDARSKQAAQVCGSLARLVKEGKTSRASAMAQLRSAAGGKLPGACN